MEFCDHYRKAKHSAYFTAKMQVCYAIYKKQHPIKSAVFYDRYSKNIIYLNFLGNLESSYLYSE